MYLHILFIITIILIFGAFGGVINFILSQNAKNKDTPKPDLRNSIVIGIGASILVPLFLNMISSSILKDSINDVNNYFIFAGFCLIASISSRAFINSISQKLIDQLNDIQTKHTELSNRLDEVDKVVTPGIVNQLNAVQNEHANLASRIEEVDKVVSPMADKESESEVQAETLKVADYEETKAALGCINDDDSYEIRILKALAYDNYTFRSLSGLSISTGIPVETVKVELEKLMSEQLVDCSKRQNEIRFNITSQGRRKLNSKYSKEKAEV